MEVGPREKHGRSRHAGNTAILVEHTTVRYCHMVMGYCNMHIWVACVRPVMWGERNVNSTVRQQIQAACDDVHHNPDDAAAVDRLRQLLGAEARSAQANWHRLVKLACDEVYDSPEDQDARDRLLVLLAARGSATLEG